MSAKLFLLRLARAAGVFALFRRVTRSRARILCYHGGALGDEHHYNGKLFCQQHMLRQRLDWLRAKGFTPTSLDRISTPGRMMHPGDGIPLAITLDDGWYSSEVCLLPLFAEYGHRPVLYLHTEICETDAPVAGVALRYLLWKTPLSQVVISGLSETLDGRYSLDMPEERIRLTRLADAWFAGMPRDAATVTAALERFSTALGVDTATLDLASRRFNYMRPDELRTASARGCQIELHGRTHQYFKGEPERNRDNIEACRQYIVAAGLPRPHHYCYPSGAYDAAAAETLAAVDVHTATTCVPGLVSSTDNAERYFLPRFLDGGNVAMIEFEAEMSGVLEFARKLTGRSGVRR